MRIVLDTDVLVSGLLSPFGPPGEIVRMVSADAIRLCVDARLLAEYEQVLLRPRFGFDPNAVATLVDYIDATSHKAASVPLGTRLPDPDDEAFLEVAIACGAEYLVTGNLVLFPLGASAGVAIVSPVAFVEAYRSTGRSRGT
ncbi:MAG: putative toxin-antitoxin system toxin component, PIN family [Armatimonadetes bacterium]|nr:putative toxin-antitoxin system toxin component, PIN family [Armatimonadota bacterium]